MKFLFIELTTIIAVVYLLPRNIVAQGVGENGTELFSNQINCDTDDNGMIRIGPCLNKKVYYAVPKQATFIECHRFCRGTITQSGEQMHLAEFRDATEQYYFNAFTLLHSCTDIRRAEFWVGGIALDYLLSNSPKYIPSSAWIWIHSGQKFNDTLGWNADGEPSRHPDHLNLQYESCVTMKPIFPSFFVHALNDFFCSDALPCLCEAPLA